MPAQRSTVWLLACSAIACVLAGCGGAAPPPQRVVLSITAPTDGATVGVRQLDVAGTVAPANATVTISGHPVQVRNGRFLLPMRLAGSSETITVTGRAQGYQPARTTTSVSFNGQTASTMQIAHKAATANRATTAHKSLPGFLGPAFEWPGGIGTASVGSSPTAPASPVTGTGTGTGQSTGSPSASSSGGAAGSPNGGTPVGGGATATPAPAPAPTPLPWTPTRVRNVYLQLCIHGNGAVTAFCQCTYQRMARAKALRSRASLLSLVRRLKRYARTHNINDLPRFMRNAVFNCVQKLPGNDPSAPLPVKRLPGIHHPSAPASSPTTTTTTTTATTPTNPAAP